MPDYLVTAHLYLPDTLAPDGQNPAVLVLCGHDHGGKTGYQMIASPLARNGFIVLVMDPPGQGERMQCIDRSSGAQWVRWGTLEHSYIDLMASLIGQDIARYFTYDAIRCVDYLLSRPEVDPERLGVTGNSGGSTQSCYLMMVDDRIKAAAPANWPTTRAAYMRTGQAHDGEQNTFGAITNGLDYDAFLSAFAPKPLIQLAAAYDFFTIEGNLETIARTRRIYELLGAPDAFEHVVGDHVHGYRKPLYQAAVRFFARHFQDKTSDDQLDLTDEPALSEEALWCTQSGQVLVDYPESVSLLDRIADDIPDPADSPEQLKAQVKRWVFADRPSEPLRPRITADIDDPTTGRHWEKIFFFTEPEICVAGVLLRALNVTVPSHVTMVLAPDGTDVLADALYGSYLHRFWSKPDQAVLVFDPRGVGSVAVDSTGEYRRQYGSLFKCCYDAVMLSDSMAAMRAFDIVRGAEYLRSRDDVADVSIYASGDVAFPALLAAAADEKIVSAQFDDLPDSYAELIGQGYYDRRILNEWTIVHDLLRHGDIAELKALLGARLAL